MIVKRNEIHQNDIILGRGGTLYKHAGNQFLRDLATSLAPTYIHSSKGEKSRLSRQMVDIVTNKEPSGRFLKLVGDTINGVFEEVHHSIAREKTSQCLRDAVKRLALLSSNDEDIAASHDSTKQRSCNPTTTPRQKEQDLWHTMAQILSQNVAQDNDNTVTQNGDIYHSNCYPEPYPYPKRDQYRTSDQLEVPFDNHNYYEPYHLSDPQLQWPPKTDYYHYQQNRQKHYAQTRPSLQYDESTFFSRDNTIEKNEQRPQTMMNPQSINLPPLQQQDVHDTRRSTE